MTADTWNDWTSLPLTWATLVPAWKPVELPAVLATPGDEPWSYAAVSGPLTLEPGSTWAFRIEVSQVKGTLALALADGAGQDGKRFMTLPPGDEPYWMSAPLFIPHRVGACLILHGLGAGGGSAVLHAVEVARLDCLPFDAWAGAWKILGKPQAA